MQTVTVTTTQLNQKQPANVQGPSIDNERSAVEFEQALEQESQRSNDSRQEASDAAKVAAQSSQQDASARQTRANDEPSPQARRDSDTSEEKVSEKPYASAETNDEMAPTRDKKAPEAAKEEQTQDWHGFLESVYGRLQAEKNENSDDNEGQKRRILKLDDLPLYHGGPVDDDATRVIKFAVEKDEEGPGVKFLEPKGATLASALNDDNAGLSSSETSEQWAALVSKLANGEVLSEDEQALVNDMLVQLEALVEKLADGDATGEVPKLNLAALNEGEQNLLAQFRELFSSIEVAGIHLENNEIVPLELEALAAQFRELLNANDFEQLESASMLAQLKLSAAESNELVTALRDFANGDDKALRALLAQSELSQLEQQQLTEALAQQLSQGKRLDANPQALAEQVVVTVAPKENNVVKALQRSVEQFREMLSGMDSTSSTSDSEAVEGDEARAIVGRMVDLFAQLSGAETNKQNPVSITPGIVSSASVANAQLNLNSAATAALQQQAPQQTAVEQARQIQQHIDLFGPQAPAQLREQVMVMVNNRHQYAEMRLDPSELGKLQIRIQMNNENQATVQFTVNSPQAREAVEQALPKLRDMLEQQGLQLADTDVREEREQQFAGREGQGNGAAGVNSESSDAEPNELTNTSRPQIIDADLGRVDYYA